MIQDNAISVLAYSKNKNAYFQRVMMAYRVYYIASNRAARRFLNSRFIQNLAKKYGCEIADGSIG